MDETSIAKGHDYLTLFVDLVNRRTIHIAEGRSGNTVVSFKKDFELHSGDYKSITEISCDMSPAFIRGIKDNLPNAKLTFDKFHVLKIINEAVNKVMRAEAASNPVLTGLRYIFLKNEANLTEYQKQKKQEISKFGLDSWRAMLIRECFQDIYKARSSEEFELLLNKWYYWATHSKLVPIIQVAKTIKCHWA